MKAKFLLMGAAAALTLAAVGYAATASNHYVSGPLQAIAEQTSKRVWVVNNDNWWTDNVALWDATNSVHHDMVKVLGDFNYGLLYADVPASCTTVVLHNTESNWTNQTDDITLKTWGTEADAIWIHSGVNAKNNRNYSFGSANLTTGNLQYLLSKYDSCSASYTNGYNAYLQFNFNFIATNTVYDGSQAVFDGDSEHGYKGVYPTIDQKINYMKVKSGN